jgi:hypothetical protein
MSTAPGNFPAARALRAEFIPDVSGIAPVSYRCCWNRRDVVAVCTDVAMPVAQGTSLTRDFRLISAEPVHTMIRYRATSYPNAPMDLRLPDWLRTRETRLPDDDNPRIVAFAKDLAARSDGNEAFLANALQYIRTEPFFYTLNPPPVTPARDAFWSFASRFLQSLCKRTRAPARAVGIPARMVGGYRGGEVNPLTRHPFSRQFDAHACWRGLDARWVRPTRPGTHRHG